jgi:hypothetical protein
MQRTSGHGSNYGQSIHRGVAKSDRLGNNATLTTHVSTFLTFSFPIKAAQEYEVLAKYENAWATRDFVFVFLDGQRKSHLNNMRMWT